MTNPIIQQPSPKINPGKNLIIVGASIAAGGGATVYGNSWAGLLTTSLTALGWQAENTAISGQSTTTILARFVNDIVSRRPSVCLISCTLQNESFIGSGTKSAVVDLYLSNIAEMVRLCRQNDIVPVITTPTPNDSFISGDSPYLARIFDAFERMGAHVLDFFNPAAEPDTNNYVTALQSDGVHPNDTGHLAIFSGIPVGLFDLAGQPIMQLIQPNKMEWSFAGVGGDPLEYTPDTSLRSFTAAFFAACNTSGKRIFGWIDDNAAVTRLRTANASAAAKFALTTGAAAELDTNVAIDTAYHHFVIRWNYEKQKLDLWHNGTRVSTGITYTRATNLAALGFMDSPSGGGGPAPGFMTRMAIWRSPLSTTQCARLFAGKLPRRSLEFYSTFGSGEVAINARADNLVPSRAKAVVNTTDVGVTASGQTLPW